MRGLVKCIFVFLIQLPFGLGELHAQKFPQNYFRYPLDSLPNLVSPFGSLRANHFHSGIDLRTNGKEGLPVYAAADGYISRIKIQRNGYGKALYIEHENGFATVYGHLQKYHGPLADWIHRYQYINKTFEFDKIFIKPFLFVKKGDTIGFSGNSGSSTGPHLHYEIRDSKTEKIINPALFGLVPYDTFQPLIQRVVFYKFITEGLLLKKQLMVNAKTVFFRDSLWMFKDTLALDADFYGLGIEAYDYIHNDRDEKGIYEYNLLWNGAQVFTHRLNQFAFDESKYINAHIDFPYYILQKQRIQKCFIDDGNNFKTYSQVKNKGRIGLRENSTGSLLLSVMDFNRNTYFLQINYRVLPAIQDPDRLAYEATLKGKPFIIPGVPSKINGPGVEILMDPKSVYDTVYYDLTVLPRQEGTFSDEFAFHTPVVPIHAPFDIAIKPEFYPAGFEKKLLLAYSHPKSESLRSAGGNFEKGWVKGKGNNFGNYCVVLDTLPPSVKLLKHPAGESDPADTSSWNFEVKDNFSGITQANGYLNDRWILLDFDAKNNLLTYRFDEVYEEIRQQLTGISIIEGEVPRATLLLLVEDSKGNRTEKTISLLMDKTK